MSRRVSVFLLALAVFMAAEWTMLAVNLTEGHPTSFYVVHGILIAANIALAAVLAAIGLHGWRQPKAPEA